MMDISTPEILTNVQKISRDFDINFLGKGKFPKSKPQISWEIFRLEFPGGSTNSCETVKLINELIRLLHTIHFKCFCLYANINYV